MALDGIVYAAKKNKLPRVQDAYRLKNVPKKEDNIIECEDKVADKTDKPNLSTNIEKSNCEASWQSCKYKVVSGNKHLCRKFFSGCAQDKCNPKNMEF